MDRHQETIKKKGASAGRRPVGLIGAFVTAFAVRLGVGAVAHMSRPGVETVAID